VERSAYRIQPQFAGKNRVKIFVNFFESNEIGDQNADGGGETEANDRQKTYEFIDGEAKERRLCNSACARCVIRPIRYVKRIRYNGGDVTDDSHLFHVPYTNTRVWYGTACVVFFFFF